MYANQHYQSDEEEGVENGVAAMAQFLNAIKESSMLKLLFITIRKTLEKYVCKHSNSVLLKKMINVGCMRQLSGNNLNAMAQWGISHHIHSKKEFKGFWVKKFFW